MQINEASPTQLARIEQLYTTAFPIEERPPFTVLTERTINNIGHMNIITEANAFIGFFYTICEKDLIYLFFFALDQSVRAQGYGSAVLHELQKNNPSSRIFLAREQLDPSSDNYDQRLKRHAFYLKNGFKDLPYLIHEGDMYYDSMGVGNAPLIEEYNHMMLQWAGTDLINSMPFELIPNKNASLK